MEPSSRLRAGTDRPRLARTFIEHERRRAFAGVAADLIHEVGVDGVTVALLVSGVGSSRNTFYELFANTQDCLRFAVKEARERLLAPVREVEPKTDWASRVLNAVGGFYGAVAASPNLAELLILRSFAISRGPDQDGLEGAVADLRELVAGGREASEEPSVHQSALLDEYYACGVIAVASRALQRGEADRLPDRTQEVASLVASAYLDISEVDRVLPLR